jgi:hypothetical protein
MMFGSGFGRCQGSAGFTPRHTANTTKRRPDFACALRGVNPALPGDNAK